jgi:hypothetical protein
VDVTKQEPTPVRVGLLGSRVEVVTENAREPFGAAAAALLVGD